MILIWLFQPGMIQDEELWIAALVSRNNVAHAYNKEVALDIIYDTKDKYYKMFERLEKVLRENWLSTGEHHEKRDHHRQSCDQ